MLVYHVTLKRNLRRILKEGLFPRIGSNAKAAGETRQAVYCFQSMEDVNNALQNWFGELLSEQDDIVILTIDIAGLLYELDAGGWEARLYQTVPFQCIRHVADEFGTALAA